MTTECIFNTLGQEKQAKIVNDLMELFRSNERGYGVGEFQGARFDEDKNKWYPGGVRWAWGAITADKWYDHLSGVRLLGLGVLCDDNRVWYACLDVDIYDIDYFDEMSKIKRSGLPLVVFRTKSGGLRVTIFFSEAIDGELVISRMRRLAALLGYSGCEIFPKQSKLDVANGDCPSWIYAPLGATGGIFPEQGCMTESGSLMEIGECVTYAKSRRLTKAKFLELFAAEKTAEASGKATGRKHPEGSWVEEESYELTLNTMFHDGPVCLWIIAHNRCGHMQNNFLLNVAGFLKKKYEENWDRALTWVNYNVLQPVGDSGRLRDIIERLRNQKYEYQCHDEPIHSHCDAHACRLKKWGVGQNGKSVDLGDMGLTQINRIPRIYFANLGTNGEARMQLESDELLTLRKFKTKCMDYGLPIPTISKQPDWERIVNKNLETATIIEPSQAMRTNAYELEILGTWFSIYVPYFMRYGDKPDDGVRVRLDERRIYFKWKSLQRYVMRSLNGVDLKAMRTFVENKKNCAYHSQGPNAREWWRSTYSMSFDQLDEEDVEKWFNREDPNA